MQSSEEDVSGAAMPRAPRSAAETILAQWRLKAGERVVVLMILADSAAESGESRSTAEEHRRIAATLQASTHRDAFEVVLVTAAGLADLRSALLRHQPHVLHISGRCNASGGLLLAGEGERSRVVSAERMGKLLMALRDRLQLVVFNARNSLALARRVEAVVPEVVGMDDRLANDAAIGFSVVFYEALAEARTARVAFDLGVNALSDSDQEHVPRMSPFRRGARNCRGRSPASTGAGGSWSARWWQRQRSPSCCRRGRARRR